MVQETQERWKKERSKIQPEPCLQYRCTSTKLSLRTGLDNVQAKLMAYCKHREINARHVCIDLTPLLVHRVDAFSSSRHDDALHRFFGIAKLLNSKTSWSCIGLPCCFRAFFADICQMSAKLFRSANGLDGCAPENKERKRKGGRETESSPRKEGKRL